MASIISNLTSKGKQIPNGKRNHSKKEFNTMQKSISQALEKWKFEELMIENNIKGAVNTSGSNQPVQRTNKMKNALTLATFVKSPSSQQVIHEEKKITRRDIFNAQGTQQEELLAVSFRRKKKRSAMKERNDHILRLSKSGMQTQL